MNLYSLHKNPASLSGYEDRLKVPNLLWTEASWTPSLLQNPEHIKTLAKHPDTALKYALKMKEPFPEGEAAISKDPGASESYASEVLKTPFPKGEAAIATDAHCSYFYAMNALKKAPFPAGEAAIATDATCSYEYALGVLKYPNPKSWASDYRKKHNL